MLHFIVIFVFHFLVSSYQHDLKGFDDTILFDLHWPGENSENIDFENAESVLITTSHQEKYQCILPKIQDAEHQNEEIYNGPSAIELITPLFNKAPCTYKFEIYWTYEICHGRFIRQYHEDREGKKVKLQEYILGKWDEKELDLVLERMKDEDSNTPLPMKKVESTNLPYVEVTLGNGTLCDLSNKPRETKVQYVCYMHGKHEAYSLKETSTCQYEIVILTPLLCVHPKYKPKDTGENKINCIPAEGSPSKPYNLLKMKAESNKLRRMSDRFKVDLISLDNIDAAKMKLMQDPSPVESFLEGKNCLNGGTGWWKYEFCYGKSVRQYHVDKDGSKVSINLGLFSKQRHLEWIKEHPNKRPKALSQRTQLSHFYSSGDICDKTGKPRQTEVKLKCLENASSLSAVSLYLLEPKYCEYILGVESPLICDILSRADEDGLIPNEDEVEIEKDGDVPNIKL